MRWTAAVVVGLAAGASALNGTCPSDGKCPASAGSSKGLPCCQITDSTYECCFSSESCIAKVGCRCADGKRAADATPHLAQAWQAQSTGDGLPGKTGLESYIYEDCKDKSDTCMNGHIFNYGADTCIKYEVDRGVHSPFSGTYYVKCDGLNCCTAGKHQIPNVKKWDIGQAGPLLNDKVTYLGKKDTTGLNNEPVKGADTYFEEFDIPFAKLKANYTYYVTTNGTDVITHRIQYGVQGQTAGVILYGDFKVQHNLTEFRSLFEAPAECLKPNTLTCPSDKMAEWDRKYFN